MKYLILCSLFLSCLCSWQATTEAVGKILYIPLDNRPVCLSYVEDTVSKAGYKLATPPVKLLANHKDDAKVEGLWKWLEAQAPTASAAVIATDALNYGGLVASRKHDHTTRYLKKKVQRLHTLKQNTPTLRIFAFSTIMRTPRQTAGNVEPDYYQTFGPSLFRLSQLYDKSDLKGLTSAEYAERDRLENKIPFYLMHDWFERRKKNKTVNEQLISMAQAKDFHFLALGKDDDAPLSATHMESRQLALTAKHLPANRFQIIPGVDQLGLLLITRAIGESNGFTPRFNICYAPGKGGASIPLYSDQSYATSISEQIALLGGKQVSSPSKADLVLAVNTPYNGICQDSTSNENASYVAPYNKAFAKTLKKLTRENYPVALADVSYANGADNGFMAELEKQKLLPQLTAYSGWNTADNSIGYALAQGLLARRMKPAAREALLKTRYIDDWIYQANIRPQLSNQIDRTHSFKLKYDMGKHYNRILISTNRLLKQSLKEVPSLQGNSYALEFPWNRLFEIDVKVN